MTPSRSISQSSDHADIFYHAITTHFLNLAFTPVFFLITSSCPKNSHLHIILTGGPVDVSIFLISIMLQYRGGVLYRQLKNNIWRGLNDFTWLAYFVTSYLKLGQLTSYLDRTFGPPARPTNIRVFRFVFFHKVGIKCTLSREFFEIFSKYNF